MRLERWEVIVKHLPSPAATASDPPAAREGTRIIGEVLTFHVGLHPFTI
jgi:hypothetical protein